MTDLSRIIIVNEKDEEIGVAPRNEISYPQIYRVSALWLNSSKGEILLAQRSLSKKNSPGKWGPAAAGTVEEGETYRSNLEKEMNEELGIRGILLNESWKRPFSRDKPYFVQFFSATLDHSIHYFKVPNAEVKAVAWYSPEKLKQELTANPAKFVGAMPEYVAYFLK